MAKFNYYDLIAQNYDHTRWLTEPIAEEVADFMVNLVEANPETSFLEAGVGTGVNVLPLVKRGYVVTGIDVSQEMLNQFLQKLPEVQSNLNLVCADASQLDFPDRSFDVVLTVHMIHTVANWQKFLDDIDRVLKPNGFYLNAQCITPPARMEFESYFRAILAKYEAQDSQPEPKPIAKINIDIDQYFLNKGYQSNYLIAKEWKVSNTVRELLSFFKLRAYGFCWRVSEEILEKAISEFENFCVKQYGSLDTELSSTAKFEIWAYRQII